MLHCDMAAPGAMAHEGERYALFDIAPTWRLAMSNAQAAAQQIAPARPDILPSNPSFSSGPCPKRPGWSFEALAKHAYLGRSHRARAPKAQIADVISLMQELLELPDDYRIGIVPASDTGAFEMALWSMLGARPVQVFAWESFGKGWANDIKLLGVDAEFIDAPYGELPDMQKARIDADLVFAWNGTTSGVRVAGGDFIADDREGLSFVDATSAVFATPLPWSKIDVASFSWQKALGGEAAHGVLILSPRAVERLESYAPPRPLPKIFRLTKGGKLLEGIFTGATINTVSMMAVADALDALLWVREAGGLDAMCARADANFAALQAWVDDRDWIENLAHDPNARSNTSVCLRLRGLSEGFAKELVTLLDQEGAAFDIGSYRDAPEGLRIWCGPTVETEDIKTLTKWLDWGHAALKAEIEQGKEQ